MATTEDAVIDSIRDAVVALGYREAVGFDFTKAPTTSIDGQFIVSFEGDPPIGQMGMHEEAIGRVTVQVVRMTDDYQTARRTVWQDVRAIRNAIVEASGEFAVDDSGTAMTVEVPKGANHLLGTVTLPLNFECEL